MNKLFFDQALLPDGWADNVLITWDEDGVITSVAGGAEAGSDIERAAIGVPGMSNLHSHAFQRGMAGLAERAGPSDDSFWTWREEMYRFVGILSPGQMEAIAAMAYCEMLEAGFITVGEFHYLHNDPQGQPYDDPGEMAGRIAAAALTTGIGLTLLPVFYAHGDFGGTDLADRQARFANDLDSYDHLMGSAKRHLAQLPHAELGIAPHSLRAAATSEISALLEEYPGGPIHIHIAEQMREVDACLAWCGRRPVEHLLETCPVDGRWCLIHATHMNADEVDGVARSSAVAGLCPITEANLGDGLFAARPFLAAGGAFGIGSDSNVRICPAEELRTLEYGQRLTLQARNVLADPNTSTGRTLFEKAAAGGRSALQRTNGALAVGALCDLVALDPSRPELIGRSGDALLDSWIFCGDRSCVDRVWVAGQERVRSGRHLARDAIEQRFASVMTEVLR